MRLSILLFFIVLPVYAGFPSIQFQKLSGEFVDNKGTAFAEIGKYDLDVVKISHQDIQVKFNKKQKNLVLQDDKTTVELKFDFSFLNIFRAITFSGVDIESHSKKFELFLEQLNVYIDPNEYMISEISILTDLTQVTGVGDDIDILDGFTINGDINVDKITFGKIDHLKMVKDLKEENPDKGEEIQEKFGVQSRIPLVARNLRVMVRKKTFSGSVKLDSWINLNLYLGGNIEHDAKNNKLYIDLLKAKLSYFSIRKWVLNSIRNLKIENVDVQGTKIIFDLGKTILASGNRP